MRVDYTQLEEAWKQANSQGNNLFSFPAQSNFSGVQHPLSWIKEAKSQGWDVLLDAAAFIPTNQLDLSKVAPDFVALSFYKIFGYPTGLGALIVRREALSKLRRPWFSGGTITVVSIQGDKHYLAEGHTAFEDGTVDFLNIPAIEIGLRHIREVGYSTIHERVRCLTGWMLDNLSKMKHSNGAPFTRIYGPLDTEMRGGTIAANFFNKAGKPFNHRYIEDKANEAGISLRSGCFCNPGASEIALGLKRSEILKCISREAYQHHLSYEDYNDCFDEREVGAVRISVGIASNFTDVQRLIGFLGGFLA
jgi:selenocysteine lyase/cysteine desulfurase